MKLLDIWNARDAFGRLTQLKMPPKMAYWLVKYGRRFMKEYGIIEEHKNKLVFECACVESGTPNTVLEVNTKEHVEFVQKFTEFLQTESTLERVEISFEDLIEGLASKDGNLMTEADLELLEPFFMLVKPTLTLVEKA